MGYEPRKYRATSAPESFQTDLYEKEEQLNMDTFVDSCSKSEAFSLMNDLSDEDKIREFGKVVNSFDARLIGIVNEWAEASDKEYARDGIMLDGKTATEYMYSEGKSFTDVVCEVQASFDNPDKSPFRDIKVSIGGPALMTEENLCETISKHGQIHADDREKSDLKDALMPRGAEDRISKNREFIEEEQKYFKEASAALVSQAKLKDMIERETSAMKIMPSGADGKFSFMYVSDEGIVEKGLTDENTISKHKEEYELNKGILERKPDIKRMGKPKAVREKIGLEDLQDNKRTLHRRRSTEAGVSRDKSIDRDRGKGKE